MKNKKLIILILLLLVVAVGYDNKSANDESKNGEEDYSASDNNAKVTSDELSFNIELE